MNKVLEAPFETNLADLFVDFNIIPREPLCY